MKIAIVSDAIYPYNKGGKEKRIYEISTRLVGLGHEVHIYCMKWPSLTTVSEGVHFHAISPYYPLYSGERRSIKQAILFGFSCFKLLFEDFDVIDVDHMPFFPLYSMKLVCLLKGKNMIATWHEVWGLSYWKQYLGMFGFIAYLIERLSVILPDRIIAVSKLTADRLRTEFRIRQPISVIPNGIDYEMIRKVIPSDVKSDIIFVGRLLNHKHIDILLKSINLLKKEVPQIKAIIVGDGPEKNNLIKLTKELKLEKNIVFYGSNTSQEDVYAFMKSSKVFVLPSTREGFGIVVLEANACGIPVITVDHPDNAAKDLIQHNVNGTVTTLSTKDIASEIKAIFTKNSAFHPTRNGLHSWHRSISNLLEVYGL